MIQTTWTPDSLAGWRNFVAYQAKRPDVLSLKERNALTPLLREQYDDSRIEFINAPIVLPTPDLNRLIREAKIITGLNRGAQFTARQSLAVSGTQTLGKSTAAMYLGRIHEEIERAKHSRENDQGIAPVLYVSTPPQTSPKGLMMRFASTLGLPVRARTTTDQVMDLVVETLRELGTTMVILDEVQHLKTRAQAGMEAASALKSFSERVPATFLFVGVDLPRSDFLGGAMGAQMQGRTTMIQMQPYSIGSEKHLRTNENFKGQTFTFPGTTMERETSPFRLSRVDDDAIKQAARKVQDQGGVLTREAIVFHGERLTTREEEDVRVSSLRLDSAQAKNDLIKSVMGLRVFDSSDPENLSVLKNHIVPLLVAESGITEWTVKLLASALARVREVIERAAREHVQGQGTKTVLHPHVLPVGTEYTLPLGKTVLELLPANSKGEDFLRYQHYGQWSKGLFDAAAFDSFSAEYRIAAMLNRSGSIRWWKRLYYSDNAIIAYTLEQNYRPDFVALDVDGYYWIIEGKAESGKDDQVVQTKRKAAEEAIRLISAHPSFEGQRWGYVIAYESDVKGADSWEDLLAGSNPVKTQG